MTKVQLSLVLLSGSSIFLEIGLTRLFSTLFFPPYVFAIISVAVLGIGLGAALATACPAWRRSHRSPFYLVAAGYSTLVLLLTLVGTVSINLHGALLPLVLLPYLFIGLTLASIFSDSPATSPWLYRTDLFGAGLGAILAIPLMNSLGGVNNLFFVAAAFGLAAFVASGDLTNQNPGLSKKPGGWASRSALFLCGLALIGLITNQIPHLRWLTVDMTHLALAKPITTSLAAGGHIIHTTWDSFARTDLVDPGQGKPYELYIDGAAGSVMPPADNLSLLRTDIGFFPFATAQPKQVLVIGPGGGLDVWFALKGQAESITAVEINPASVVIANQFAAYHGDLYRQPQVQVLVDEGRSVLRRTGQRYDLIYLSQVVTLATERNGYALTENTIYTVEAFKDYLNHLRPGGQIALKLYDELTLTRALVTAATALSQARGLTEAEAMAHLAVFLDPDAEPPVPLLLIQDQPFTPEDASAYAGVAHQVDFVPLFVPGVTSEPTLADILSGKRSISSIVTASSSDLSPTTDDRPFFYQFERGVPVSLWPLLVGLGLLLLLGVIALIIFQQPVNEPPARYAPLYFAALGVGFMMVEMALIQQARLFLGHPTLAVTTILAVLLIGGGIGSGLAGRWPESAKPTWMVRVTVLIVGLGLVWLFGWPWLSNAFLASQTPGRLIIASVSVLPLAILMGIPFPMGLWFVGQLQSGDRHIALGWAVNGVMTVVGSAAAVALAMLAGFSSVLLVGIGAYGLAAVCTYLISRQD